MAANSVSSLFSMLVNATETLGTTPVGSEAIGSANNTVIHNAFSIGATLNAGSTPPATKVAAWSQALVAGEATIDLEALPGANGIADQSFAGLKVQLAIFRNPTENANTITLTEGDANPYLIFGTGMVIVLQPGQQVMFYGNDAAPDVGGAASDWQLDGTGAQELEIILVAG